MRICMTTRGNVVFWSNESLENSRAMSKDALFERVETLDDGFSALQAT